MDPSSLSDLLLQATANGPPPPDDRRSTGRLELLLAEILRSAQAAWPAVDVAPERFIPYLAGRLPADGRPDVALGQMHTADLYLACACAHGDAAAIEIFDAHCIAGLDRPLLRLVGADVAADIKQQIRFQLLVADMGPPQIVEFMGRGDLRGWVRVMAVHDALQIVRRQRKETPIASEQIVEALLPPSDPELQYLKRVYRSEFHAAFAEAVGSLSDREQTLLRQQLIDDLTIDELGRLYSVHRATAARWLERTRQSVLSRTRALLIEQLNVQPAEVDSILRLIQSHLDVSLRGVLRQRKR